MLLSAGFTIQGLVCAALLRPVRTEKSSIDRVSSAEIGNIGVCDSDRIGKKTQMTKYKGTWSVLFETFDLSLWKQKAFIFLLLGGCFGMISPSVMLTYAISRAMRA